MLSKNYYASVASLNEMGAAWITKASSTLLLLPGFKFSEIEECIDSQKMGICFDMGDAELEHRLNELKDMLISEHSLPVISETRWKRHRDVFIKKVKEIIETQKNERSEIEDERLYIPPVGLKDSKAIPIEPAFLLVYAADNDGQIVKITTLSGTSISAAGKCFMVNDSPREVARWQEAIDQLLSWHWIRSTGFKGQVFELTGTGYKKADWLKEELDIDTSKEPLDQ